MTRILMTEFENMWKEANVAQFEAMTLNPHDGMARN
jgi:hypothetical protein